MVRVVGVRSSWLAVCVLVAFVGCEASERASDDDAVETVQSALTVNFTIPVAAGVNPSDVALGASGQLLVNDRTQVREQANATDLAMGTNVGTVVGSTTNIGVSTQLGTIDSVPRVTLRNNSLVSGSVYEGPAGGPVTQGPFTVTGFISQDALPSMTVDSSWSRSVTWPVNVNPSVSLEPSQTPTTVALTPAAYHDVSVKSGRVLQLRTGTYYFDSLRVEPQAGLQINGQAGPVYVFVNGVVSYAGNQNGSIPTPGMPYASLTIMTSNSAFVGGSPTLSRFNGVVIAPNGSVSLSGIFQGAFFGRNVTLFEDSRLSHVRDPYSFRGFGAADRVSVTGNSIRKGEDRMDEFLQSETVSAVSRVGQQFIVAVGYNDKTTGVTNPEVSYPAGRTGNQRIVRRGTSLMGWSYSTDGGYTFNYGGRVAPPAGWAAIWSDPAIAKTAIDDPNVYYAQMAVSDTAFVTGAGYDANTDTIINATPSPDGYCIARSTDRGVTFSKTACVVIPPSGFGIDGTALAAVTTNAGAREVYLSFHAGGDGPIWRMNGDGDTMTFTELPHVPLPPGGGGIRLHPSLRQVNGTLYFVAVDTADRVFGATLDARNSATTWNGPFVLATGVSPHFAGVVGASRGVSFDVGGDGSGTSKFRLMYVVDEGGNLKNALVTRECNVDLTNCHDLPWNTRGQPGDENRPSLRNAGGSRWVAQWYAEPANLGLASVVAGQLRALIIPPSQNDLVVKVLSPPVAPCTMAGYYGDYDEIDSYGDLRIFASFTVNGPGCRYQGTRMADHHVGGAIVSF